MAVEAHCALMGDVKAHQAFLLRAFGVPFADDKATGVKQFKLTVEGETKTFWLHFHAHTLKSSYNPHQARQPLIIFVNMPCTGSKVAQEEALSSHVNVYNTLKAPRDDEEFRGSKPEPPTGLVTLYMSLPHEGERTQTLEEERAWAKKHLLIDDGKVFELGSNAAWVEMLPRLYKHAERAQRLADRATGKQTAALDAQQTKGDVCKGYIIKLGGIRHNWKKRWLVLDHSEFRYYRTAAKKLELVLDEEPASDLLHLCKAIGIAKVTAAKRIEVPSEAPRQLAAYSFFSIATQVEEEREFIMCCATPEEAARWEDQFQEALVRAEIK